VSESAIVSAFTSQNDPDEHIRQNEHPRCLRFTKRPAFGDGIRRRSPARPATTIALTLIGMSPAAARMGLDKLVTPDAPRGDANGPRSTQSLRWTPLAGLRAAGIE